MKLTNLFYFWRLRRLKRRADRLSARAKRAEAAFNKLNLRSVNRNIARGRLSF